MSALKCPTCGDEHTVESKFYVGVRRNTATAFLLGPYDTHAEADSNAERGRDLAIMVDHRIVFDRLVTVATPPNEHTKTAFGR